MHQYRVFVVKTPATMSILTIRQHPINAAFFVETNHNTGEGNMHYLVQDRNGPHYETTPTSNPRRLDGWLVCDEVGVTQASKYPAAWEGLLNPSGHARPCDGDFRQNLEHAQEVLKAFGAALLAEDSTRRGGSRGRPVNGAVGVLDVALPMLLEAGLVEKRLFV